MLAPHDHLHGLDASVAFERNLGISVLPLVLHIARWRKRHGVGQQQDRLHVLPHQHSEHAGVHHSYLAAFLRGFGASVRLFAEANALDHFSGKSFRDVGVVVLRPNPVPTCQMPEVIEIDGRLPAGYIALGLNLDIHDEAFYCGCLYARDALLGFKDNLLELLF